MCAAPCLHCCLALLNEGTATSAHHTEHDASCREKDAAALVRTIVSVVAHCHLLGVVHRCDARLWAILLVTRWEQR